MAARMGCLDDLTITNLVGNALPDPQRVAALAHLDDCRTCSELVAAMAVGSPRTDAEPTRLAPGTAVGRYIVERVAGAGAMGVVYAARDPSLDRTVALKLVAASDDARAQERMLREAKAMAQLSHRNVVSIFDVGTFGDDVFLAMEYLPGRTLRQWLAERARKPREIVAVLAEAGRGLEAAHAAGIVHRDVKPDNVLIAGDSRVCVTDFGLARPADTMPERAPPSDAPIDALTATGHILGTPVYMAPEQLAGGAADLRSDQFSFCVVAYECLAGRRPFEGRTLAELRESLARPAPPIARAPAWMQRVILRGLATDPDQRYPSMTALLAALARDPAIRYRRFAIAGGALALVAGVAVAVPRGAADACPDPRDRLTGTWDATRRGQLQRAFAAKPQPFTQAVLGTVTTALDRYADQWVAVRLDACRATYERRDQSEARYDAELACLERRRGELAATVDVLANSPDDQTLRSAVTLVQRLPDLRPCRDGKALVEQTPLPAHPVARLQVDAAYRTLASARSLAQAGKFASAQRIVDELVPKARSLAFGPLLADTLYTDGKLQMLRTTRDAVAAQRVLEEAATLAAASKDDLLAAKVALQLAYTIGAMARRFPEAASLARVARTAIQRAGDPEDLVLDWHNVVGATLVEQGKFDEALQYFRDALALAERPTARDRTRLPDQLTKLAQVLYNAGRAPEARAPAERAVELTQAQVGPDHPDLAQALVTLGAIHHAAAQYADALRVTQRALSIYDRLGESGDFHATEAIEGVANAYSQLGNLDEARKHHERALAIREATPGDPHVGDSLINLGLVFIAQGELAKARASIDRALDVYRKIYGPDHPSVAVALRTRSQLVMGTPAAVADLEEALRITTAAAGPDHREVGVQHLNLGGAYATLGRWRESQEHFERAIKNHEQAVGGDHEMMAFSLSGLGEAMIERHQPAAAIPILERALAIFEANHSQPARKAIARWFLVRALWDSKRDRKRARELANQVKADVADAKDPTSQQIRAAVTAWLAKH
jgi:tetratricopeptide (TPR) repeat protein/predicted Ser/Thr protein kinase